jgi:tetratricopeptide (TPR) repeat protein
MKRAFAAALVVLAATSAGVVRAADPADRRAAANEAFARAEAASKALRFADALSGYREVLASDPSAPFASVSRARATDLEAQAEGGFAPLARLEAVRRSPAKLADRAEIDALARDAEGFPPGRVRGEARLVVGESLRRLKDGPAAELALRQAASDDAADPLTKSLALSDLIAVLRDRGDLKAALAELDARPGVLPTLRIDVARLVRRERLRNVAFAVLGALALAALIAVVRLVRRLPDPRSLPSAVGKPLPIAAALYLGGAGAAVAAFRGDGDPRPFVVLGAGIAAVALAARALSLAGSRRPLWRTVRAIGCFLAVLSVAFLAIERTEAGYLSSFGL